MFRAILFFGLATSAFTASESLHALVNASASFTAAIQEQSAEKSRKYGGVLLGSNLFESCNNFIGKSQHFLGRLADSYVKH